MMFIDSLYLAAGLMLGVLCLVIAIIANNRANTKFRLVYLSVLLLSFIFVGITGYDISFLAAYIISALLTLGFFIEKKSFRMVLSIAVITTMLAEFVICDSYLGYRAPNYLAEYDDAFEKLKEHYSLTEYKDIDFDYLNEKYRPLFEDANRRHDRVSNYIAWVNFCGEFRDGHVMFFDNLTEEELEAVSEKLYGYDFGFSLIRMNDGRIVAVNVEPGSEAEEAGIKNGTEIVTWNGLPVEKMVEGFDAALYMNYPVRESEDYLRVVFSAGQSGDSLTVGFIADKGAGNEEAAEGDLGNNESAVDEGGIAITEVTLNKIGIYHNRLDDTLSKLLDGTFETNLTVRRINDNTAFMRISGMAYDTNSYGGNDYSAMYEEVRAKLQEQKDAGVTDLIIDIRANSGGDPEFDKSLFRLLFPQGEYVLEYNAVWDYDNSCYMRSSDGKYITGTDNKFFGEGFWGDGNIILLVSATTISAGDMFTYAMSQLENVTIMGVTPTNCSGQAVRGIEMTHGILSFSSVPALHADGSIFIDPDSSGKATIPVDKYVLVNDEFIDAIFNRGEDYVLDCAIDILAN